MTAVAHGVALAVLALGTILELLAVLGLVAMRDTYDRLHYLGMAGWGAFLIGVSILLRQSFSLIGDKALATGTLVVLLGPVLAHTTARSLRIRELGDWRAGIDSHREEGLK